MAQEQDTQYERLGGRGRKLPTIIDAVAQLIGFIGPVFSIEDKQAWSISNMDAVKGHEGHHVKVKAKLNEADHSLNVEKLSMMRKGKQTAEEKKQEEKK